VEKRAINKEIAHNQGVDLIQVLQDQDHLLTQADAVEVDTTEIAEEEMREIDVIEEVALPVNPDLWAETDIEVDLEIVKILAVSQLILEEAVVEQILEKRDKHQDLSQSQTVEIDPIVPPVKVIENREMQVQKMRKLVALQRIKVNQMVVQRLRRVLQQITVLKMLKANLIESKS
jgi:hypothetical protein